ASSNATLPPLCGALRSHLAVIRRQSTPHIGRVGPISDEMSKPGADLRKNRGLLSKEYAAVGLPIQMLGRRCRRRATYSRGPILRRHCDRRTTVVERGGDPPAPHMSISQKC